MYVRAKDQVRSSSAPERGSGHIWSAGLPQLKRWRLTRTLLLGPAAVGPLLHDRSFQGHAAGGSLLGMTTLLAIVLLLVGAISTAAWFRASGSEHTSTQKHAYVLLALACWVSLYFLANIQLAHD
jgi:hypothetical protein